jgi:hypothetical protein
MISKWGGRWKGNRREFGGQMPNKEFMRGARRLYMDCYNTTAYKKVDLGIQTP